MLSVAATLLVLELELVVVVDELPSELIVASGLVVASLVTVCYTSKTGAPRSIEPVAKASVWAAFAASSSASLSFSMP